MWKTKILTEHLQEEKLDIIDAQTAIDGRKYHLTSEKECFR